MFDIKQEAMMAKKEREAFIPYLLAGTVQARMSPDVLQTFVARDSLGVSYQWVFGTFAVQQIRRAGHQSVKLVPKLAWQV